MARQGWRRFSCEECKCVFERACRDASSPSGEDCICGEWLIPIFYKIDESIPVDKFGNLTKLIDDRLWTD